MRKLIKSKYIQLTIMVLSGIFLGWLFFHQSSEVKHVKSIETTNTEKVIWTCAMHPQIHRDTPGNCPICGMELIPLGQNKVAIPSGSISMDESAMEIANIQTSLVTFHKPVKDISLYGKIQPDEQLIQTLPAYYAGRIEQLNVNFTGETITKGQLVAIIYSPELITAQQELLEALKFRDTNPTLLEAAREKLRQWKLSETQIANLEKNGEIKENMEILSAISGTVINRTVNTGDYVSRGESLFEVVNLSKVWVIFDAYESDLPWIHMGALVKFTVPSIPDKEFQGKVSFIEPVINPQTRVVGVRIEINNPDGILKPEMFVSGNIQSQPEPKAVLAVPKSAVLWTGKRSIVYVKDTHSKMPVFTLREVTLGMMTGDSWVISEGLKAGEEIVSNGTFAVDAAAQLAGKNSMMNPGEKPNVQSSKHKAEVTPVNNNNRVTVISFKVYGNCDLCKERIETTVKALSGVLSADWNVDIKILNLKFNASKIKLDSIQQAIALVGHDTEKYKAPDKVYEALPECCHYRGK